MDQISAKPGSVLITMRAIVACWLSLACVLGGSASGQSAGLNFRSKPPSPLSASDVTAQTDLDEPNDDAPDEAAIDAEAESVARNVASSSKRAFPRFRLGGKRATRDAMTKPADNEVYGSPLPVIVDAPPGLGLEIGGVEAGADMGAIGGATPSGAGSSSGTGSGSSSSGANMPFKHPGAPLKPRFGNGFELRTEDEEFSFQLHALIQADGRFYEQGDQRPVTDTFAFPRLRFIFNGTVGKPYEYFVSFNHGFNNLTLLDAFFNVHFDDRMQFKLGRFKTPFTYEFYAIGIPGLATPERSLFLSNFGLGRDTGAMLWGTVWDKKLDYAAGIFNGSRNGFLDANDEKDLAAFVNWKPFADQKDTLFEHLQIGGSVNYGNQFNDPNPPTLRLLTPTPGNAVSGPEFLAYNAGVVEQGERAFWSAHAAWFAGPFSLYGEYQAGYQSMAVGPIAPRTKVALDSFYVTAAWFLTGESVASRGALKPNQNFDLRQGKEGIGAVELFTRYNLLDIDRNVFDAGLADPSKWTNRVQTIDVGFNWYWNSNVRWVFAWERALFGDPVEFASGRSHINSDEFLFRCQVAF